MCQKLVYDKVLQFGNLDKNEYNREHRYAIWDQQNIVKHKQAFYENQDVL